MVLQKQQNTVDHQQQPPETLEPGSCGSSGGGKGRAGE